MSEFEWFIKICDWEFDYMDKDDLSVDDLGQAYEQIEARLKGVGVTPRLDLAVGKGGESRIDRNDPATANTLSEWRQCE